MALFDLLGRSWAMGILWNLGDGPATFRELGQRCESISPTVLNRRLKELRQARWVEKSSEGYRLTESGQRLLGLLKPLGAWSKVWAVEMQQADLEPHDD